MAPERARTDARERVRVELGERGYDILIGAGLLDGIGEAIAERLGDVRVGVVTDRTVAGLHLPAVRTSLERVGLDHAVIEVEAGEPSKSWTTLERVVDGMLDARLERGDAVLALGGGVVGDLAGFASAITRRGMRLVQAPTSLLAQVDSSVGGKTGINAGAGKNLVGAFHQPSLVVADVAVLDTLSARERRAGYAEVVKYGLIDRPDFFAWLEKHWREVVNGGSGRTQAVAESCRCKAAVVAADEREGGQRALLNLGHTFGHALERFVSYDPSRLVHGEGVAIGMAVAHRFSAALDLCPAADAERVEAHLRAVGLPTRLDEVPGLAEVAAPDPHDPHDRDGRVGEPGGNPAVELLMDGIRQDKKVSRGALNFILTRGIGRAFVARDVAATDVEAHLRRELEG